MERTQGSAAARTALAAIAALAFVLASCEDGITPMAFEDVRLAILPERVLVVQPAVNGTVIQSGTFVVKDGEPFSLNVQAATGFTFYRWEQASGTGLASFAEATSPDTAVRVSGGDATIRAVIDDTIFDVQVTNGPNGTVDRSAFTGLAKDVPSVDSATATPAAEYAFQNWTVTAGAGIVFTPGASSPTVRVTASAGDATIRANFVPKTYSLSRSYGTGGYTAGSTLTVTSGVATAIVAYPYETYVFDAWVKTGGSGTASFGNANQASTTVTVTGGNVSIQATFRKENLTLSETGTLGPFPDQSIYPSDVGATWVDWTRGSVFVAGSSVLRRIDINTPANPTSLTNSYQYLSGTPSALVSDGTNLFTATTSALYRTPISGFSTLVTPASVAHAPIADLFADPGYGSGIPAFLWVARPDSLRDYQKSSLARQFYFNLTDGSGWNFRYLLANGYGVFAVMADNGAHQLGGYAIDTVSGASLAAPSSAVALHSGGDMDPGDAGRPVFNEDREFLAVPVLRGESGENEIQLHDATVPESLGAPVGAVAINGDWEELAWLGSYLYVAGSNAGVATVWIVDASDLSAPVVRKTLTIAGFAKAEYAFERNGYLWVILDDQGGETKIAVKSFAVTRN